MLSDELKALAFKHTLQYVNAICDLKEVPRARSEMRMIEDAIRAAVAEAVAAEREACAEIVTESERWLIENAGPSFATSLLGQIGGSIRARGEEP